MSWSGLCLECAAAAVAQNAAAIANKAGPEYDRWQAGNERAQANAEARILAKMAARIAPPAEQRNA